MAASKTIDISELMGHLGGFGRFQLWIFILCCYASAIPGLLVVTIIFVAYEPLYRCFIPECEFYGNTTYEEPFLNYTTPYDKAHSKWESCNSYGRYSNISYNEGNVFDRCFRDTFDEKSISNCSEYVYDKSLFTSTLVTEYNLVCERSWLQPVSSSTYMVGMLLGAIILGDLADRIGRKKGLFLASLIASVGSIACGFSQHYYMFLATRIITGVGSIAIFQIAFILAVEISPHSWRTFVGILIEVPFAIGEAFFALFAYYIRDWRTLQIAASIPCLVLLLYLWVMPESVRWLLSSGNGKEAVKVVKQIEKMNNLYIPSHVYDALDPNDGGSVTVGGAEGKERETTEDKPKRKVFDLLRYPNTRKRTINLMFCWAVVTTSYYGLSSNSAKIGSNVFTSFILIMLIEVPSYIFAFLVLDRIGRKGTLCFTLLLGGISLIISGFIPSDMHTVIVTLSMLGKSGVSAAFAVVYVYSAEIFPTLYRSIGIGSCSMCARIGGILAPFIANLDKIYRPLPPFVFGALAISSGLLVFLLPETFGSELPQTLETAENFGTDQPILYFTCLTKKKKILITDNKE